MKNKLLIIVGVLLFVLIGVGVYYSMSKKDNKTGNMVLLYNDSITYRITKTNETVNVKYEEQPQCITEPCPKLNMDYNLDFSKDNMEKVYQLFDRLGKKDKEVTISNSSLTTDEKKVMHAIVTNDESYFKKEVEGNLLFTIRYNNLNCPTVILNVNKDKTYNLITGASNDNISSTNGTYDYNVTDIINSDDISFNAVYNYQITLADGTVEYIKDDNSKLKEFLTKINVNLETCQKFE